MSKFGINVDVFCQKIHTYLREETESNLRLFFFLKTNRFGQCVESNRESHITSDNWVKLLELTGVVVSHLSTLIAS